MLTSKSSFDYPGADMSAMAMGKNRFSQFHGLIGVLIVLLSGCSSFHHVSIVSHDDKPVQEDPDILPPSSSVESQPSFPDAPDIVTLSPVKPESPGAPNIDPPLGAAISAQPAEDPNLPSALEDVFFDYDQYSIRKESVSALKQNAKILLKRYPLKEVLIEGHCDERGTEEYNLILGEKRATMVKHYLIDLGVPASQLHVLSLGKTEPFCPQPTFQCFQLNRRAHFVLK